MDMRDATIIANDVLANSLRATINLRRQRIPPPDYVLLELKGDMQEREAAKRFVERQMPFLRKGLTVKALNDRLKVIAGDPDVKGVVLHLGELQVGLAKLQNIHAAIQRLKKRGKRVIVYSPVLDLPRYYIGTAGHELVIPESSTFNVKGLASQVVFLKDTLARMGVSGDFEAIGEYKNAADPLRRSDMSDAHREVINALLDSFYEDLLAAVADGRGLVKEQVNKLIDNAPWLSRETIAAGLADTILYEDQLPQHLANGNGRVRIMPWDQAQKSLRRAYTWHGKRAIGVVSLRGIIVTGESREVPVPVPIVGTQAGSDTLARAFRKAEKDPRIAAIVFHVDSGGGDALASDLIWREVKRLREKKPVVAYMGDVAGSGGYYVLAGADHIVAQSATLTGSIGVIGGKIVTRGMYDKLNANWEIIKRGRHAIMDLPDDPYTDEEREKVLAYMNSVYELFKQRVAEGREMTVDGVEKIARGRVWTGRQALDLCLVDELGDFQVALDRAKLLAGLPLDDTVAVVPIEASKKYTPPPAFTDSQAWIRAIADGLRPFRGTQVLTLMPWTLELKY
ncbi:MAG: signal peptide peptidase SppA [Anaerolineae bacterium]